MSCGAPRRLEANGLGFRLYEWGAPEAPPALLLHSQAAHSHWWDWSAPLLAEQFHVLALDLRGHGGSAWAEPPGYAFTDYVSDAIAILDALGWRSPLLIGHSMGGYVGALLASLHPQRVGALVIVDTLAIPPRRDLSDSGGPRRREHDHGQEDLAQCGDGSEARAIRRGQGRLPSSDRGRPAAVRLARHGLAGEAGLSRGRAALTSRRRPLMLGHRLRG